MFFDLIVACRGLRRSPAFTLAAVLTLALGIGANTTMFSVVNAVLLRPLPGYQTGRLVRIQSLKGDSRLYLHPDQYLRLRERLHSFHPIAAIQNCRMNLTGGGEPEQLNARCSTANWFELQQAQALLGRTFLPDEDHHGRNRVVVLDHAFWQRRFGGDPKIVGRTLTLDGEPWLVVGVLPRDFHPIDGDCPIYTPYVVEDNPHGLNVTGRLRQGVSLEAARAELAVAAAQLAASNADWKELQLTGTPLLEEVTGPQRPLLLLLLGAVSFVLWIACVNVANLLLARSTARRREMEIRTALGATRWRLIRFALTEAALLSATASVAAVAVAYGGLRLLQPLTATLPRAEELNIDGRVLLCTLFLGVLAALLFGTLPALRTVAMPARATSRPHRWLIAGEVALAFVLLVGAGLLIRTFLAIRTADLGYDPRHVLTNFLALPPAPDGSRTAGAALYGRIRERVAALPGVQAVATASSIPMFGVSISMDVHPEGEPERRREHVASLDVISDSYFQVMRIPLRAGRSFTPTDREFSTRVSVVSQSIANRYFGGKAVGRRMVVPEALFNIDGGKDVLPEIVGVVGNVCVNSAGDCDAETIYLPESQNALRMENLLVRTVGEPKAMLSAVRHALYLEAPTVPLDEATTLEERTGYLIDAPRRAMWLLAVFAGIALLLAAVGIYGVSAYLAAQRSREIGIRMALGAGFADIAGLVYRGILLPAAGGLAIGLVSAAGLTRLLKSLLFGVTPGDPRTLAATGIALLAVSVLAATGPALRAAWMDPAKVLRRD